MWELKQLRVKTVLGPIEISFRTVMLGAEIYCFFLSIYDKIILKFRKDSLFTSSKNISLIDNWNPWVCDNSRPGAV